MHLCIRNHRTYTTNAKMKCRYGVIARTTDVNLDGAGLHKDNYAIPWGGGGQREKLFSRTLSAPSGEMCLSPRGWGGATCPDSLALCWQHREERDGDWYDMTASVGRSACVNKEGSSLFFFNIRGRAVCVCVCGRKLPVTISLWM